MSVLHLGELAVDALQAEAKGAAVGLGEGLQIIGSEKSS